MTSVTAAAAGALGALAVIAAGTSQALRRPREGFEAAAAAALAVAALLLGGDDGVLGGVAFVLGAAAALRYAHGVRGAGRSATARLFRAFERDNQAKGRFLPRTLVDRLGRSSLADVEVGDRATAPMTVLFADIRDSTALTEVLASEDAFVLIADFFARSARVVREHRGSVDKYLGDGYMALFPRCVEDALDAAVALQAAVAQLNREGLGPPIEIGVGLHTGPVTFGTVGDARHIDTTVVSDTVNTAKRVEGLSKRLRVPIVATEDVMHAVRDPARYLVRPLGAQAVRGKREPIDVLAVDPSAELRRIT
ncbi:MAG: adenylate/guanylate cyclase domain-containing protein, partial [Candidatus Eremiobacteraeota bacterium]|nr:adenylate/guanylate cyclase domain-containing protein [Candidatus Eremiobacteraeota bacterium]MBV9408721.1 adenylate/guanylate cyclase domain-containing protein [Candidatus Eremiobacteraeota bacterium]